MLIKYEVQSLYPTDIQVKVDLSGVPIDDQQTMNTFRNKITAWKSQQLVKYSVDLHGLVSIFVPNIELPG